jgi:hypothetical protein
MNARSPGAVAATGAPANDQLGGKVIWEKLSLIKISRKHASTLDSLARIVAPH